MLMAVSIVVLIVIKGNCMGKNQHVVRRKNGWGVLGENNSRASSIFETQRQAIERAREIAINQQSEVIIHGKDGKIRERNSYGNDPYPPEG
jgi:hypothetical protein